MDGHKGYKSDYLSNCKMTRLPHGLRGVVSQILVISSVEMMDEICSKACLESSQRRTGGFSWVVDRAFMRPLPALCFTGVIVLPLAISPTTGSRETLGFLVGQSPLGGGFLFMDGLLATVAVRAMSLDSFFFAAYDLISALLLVLSIFEKVNG